MMVTRYTARREARTYDVRDGSRRWVLALRRPASRGVWLGWVGLGAVGAALGSTGCAAPHVPPPQWVHGATFVRGGDGASVVLFATVPFGRRTRWYTYLRRHSLDDGALLASWESSYDDFEYRNAEWRCEPALPGRLWCLDGPGEDGLSVVDTASLRTVAVQSQMLSSISAVAGKEPFHHMRVDPKTRGFVFESLDGYAWIIDPTTLTPSRFAGTLR